MMNRKEGANRPPSDGESNQSVPFEEDAVLASKRPPARDNDYPEGPKKKKKKKKAASNLDGKLPSRPKRPLTGYNRFFREERVKWKEEQSKQEKTEVTSDNKKHAFLTMGKEISVRWVRLPREEKQKYIAEYNQEMIQYRIDVEAYEKVIREMETEDPVVDEDQSNVHSIDTEARASLPSEGVAPVSSSQAGINLLQQQISTRQNSRPPIANLGTSTFPPFSDTVFQQRQLELLLQQRLLEQQIQRQSNSLPINSLLDGSASAMSTRPFPNLLSPNLLSDLHRANAVAAFPFARPSLSAGNLHEQILSRRGLATASNNPPYNTLPGLFPSNFSLGNFSMSQRTPTYEQELLTQLLQQQLQQQQQQQDEANRYHNPKRS